MQQNTASTPWYSHPKNQRLALLGLIGLLLGVVFVLPQLVPEVSPEDIQLSESEPSAAVAESPWQDAQLARARKEAQNILAEIVARQDYLESRGVELWAADAYQSAFKQAEQGDEFYRKREFSEALTQYQLALAALEALQNQVDSTYQQQLSEGQQALLDGDSASATAHFKLALAIAPASNAANTGLQQAEVLDQILALIRHGKVFEKTGQLDDAADFYRQALALDKNSAQAQREVAAIEQQLRDNRFSKQMSSGYQALNNGDYGRAIEHFQRAQKLAPDEPAPATAITQARNQRTHAALQRKLRQAEIEESQEHWQEALALYRSALKLDDKVMAARLGQLRTEARLDLDRRLQHSLQNPDRLQEPAVLQQSQQLLLDARALPEPGPRLRAQIVALQQQLEQAVTEVAVEFRSDNQTRVTLNRVAELGTFAQHAMQLKPGIYTAIGRRQGYRDVRREFRVKSHGDNVIVIQCEDKIGTASSG